MGLPNEVKDKLTFDHLKLISSVLSDGIIIPNKTVRASSTSAAVFLPKKYIGHTFRIILLPETEKDKKAFKKENAIIERDYKISQMTRQIKTLQTKIEKLQVKQEKEVALVENDSGEPEDEY
jgi:putative transposon-encoded protein